MRVHRNRKRQPKGRLTERQYFSTSPQFQEDWDDVVHAISQMRRTGMSLSRAAEEIGINPDLIRQLGRSALRKQANGKYVAKKSDRLLRVLTRLTPDGKEQVTTRDSREASHLGAYWAAVHRYLQTGDASRLNKFRGKKITDTKGKKFSFLTDLDELNRLASAGVLSFESLYARHG